MASLEGNNSNSQFVLPRTREEAERRLYEIEMMAEPPENPVEAAFYGAVLWGHLQARFEHHLSPTDQQLWHEPPQEKRLDIRDVANPRVRLAKSFDEFICDECRNWGAWRMEMSYRVQQRKAQWEGRTDVEMMERYAAASVKHLEVLAGQKCAEVSGADIVATQESLLPDLRKFVERWRQHRATMPMKHAKKGDLVGFLEGAGSDGLLELRKALVRVREGILRQDDDIAERLAAGRKMKEAGDKPGLEAEGLLELIMAQGTGLSVRSIQRKGKAAKS